MKKLLTLALMLVTITLFAQKGFISFECFQQEEIKTVDCANCSSVSTKTVQGSGIKVKGLNENPFIVFAPIIVEIKNKKVKLKGANNTSVSFTLDKSIYSKGELLSLINDCNCVCGGGFDLATADFSVLGDAQCADIAPCLVSSDANNGLAIGSDGKLNVNPTTMTTTTAKTIGGVTYPTGTSLDDIINAMVADAMFDHMNENQSMDNGSRLHIVNGRLQYQGTITGADGFDILSANGTSMFSVDF